MSDNQFSASTPFIKVDTSLGLVLGWGIICTKNGEDYYDTQGDNLTEDCMLHASTDFMKNSNTIRDMHIAGEEGVIKGSVVHSFPLTAEIAKAFGIETSQTGWMVAMAPEDKNILQKFATGEYTGFSIGGSYVPDSIEMIND
jgi:hypothetical protein